MVLRIEPTEDVTDLIDNEWYIVRYSGEIPEIAYNSAIYFLTRATDGPQITLSNIHFDRLKQAAVDRYEEIILRDLLHENVGKSVYRGIARSICNYDRFTQFCRRQGLSPETIQHAAGQVLTGFLQTEFEQLTGKNYNPVINCSFSDLTDFAQTLYIPFLPKYSLFEPFCLSASE
ncbi:MAG: hypothetical protein ACI8PB_003242 [Desulforhopalus sp.]